VTLAVTAAVAVASKTTTDVPATAAVARFTPSAVPSVQRVLVVPLLSVVLVVGVTIPPPAVTAQETVTPLSGREPESVTRTVSAAGNSVPTKPLCPFPDTIVIDVGTDGCSWLPPPPPPQAVSASDATLTTAMRGNCDHIRIPPRSVPIQQVRPNLPSAGD